MSEVRDAFAVRLFEPDDIAAVRALYAASMRLPGSQPPNGATGTGTRTSDAPPCHPSVAKFIEAQLGGPLATATAVADRFLADGTSTLTRSGSGGAGFSPAGASAMGGGFWVATTASCADSDTQSLTGRESAAAEVIVGCIAIAGFQDSAAVHGTDRSPAADEAADAGPPSPLAPRPLAELK